MSKTCCDCANWYKFPEGGRCKLLGLERSRDDAACSGFEPAARMGFEPVKNRIDAKYGNLPETQSFDGKGDIHFRSKSEAKLAKYLEILCEAEYIAKWEYEPGWLVFPDRKTRPHRYLPDFVVTGNDGKKTIYEYKGFMTSRDRSKWRLVKEHYPEYKIVVVLARKPSPQTKSFAAWTTGVSLALKYVDDVRYLNEMTRG